jgi:hypothetical protein
MSLGVEGSPPNFPLTERTWSEPGVSTVAGLTFWFTDAGSGAPFPLPTTKP